jgi:DNA sulfur modification protein DndB
MSATSKQHPFSEQPGVTICESAEEAILKVSGQRGALALPVHAYNQGDRMFLSTVLTVPELLKTAKINTPGEGIERNIGGEEFLNRKLDQAHKDRIYSYVVETKNYILGPIILNSLEPLDTFLYGRGHVLEGYVVIPDNSVTYTIDGQHRLEGLRQAIHRKSGLTEHSIPVVISQEQDVERVRDDFASLGQTKPIDKSTLVTYQSSDFHVGIVKEIMNRAKIFRGRIQLEGSTIKKKDNYSLFTASSLSITVAELIYGGSDKSTKTKGIDSLKNEEARTFALNKAVEFYDKYATYSPKWTPLLQDKSITVSTVSLAHLREKRLDFRNTGFQIISRIGHYILFDETRKLSGDKLNTAIQLLADIDFRLDDEQSLKFWEDCGVVISSGVGTQRQVIERGVKAVWDKIYTSL